MGKEMRPGTTLNRSAAAVPVVGECAPFTRPAASINCTLVEQFQARLLSTLFSIIANKTQLFPGLYVNHVTGGGCSLTGLSSRVYVLHQDGIAKLSIP